MQQEEQSICTVTPSFNRQKPTISHCLQNPLYFHVSCFPQKAEAISHPPKALYSLTKKKRQRARVKPYRTFADE